MSIEVWGIMNKSSEDPEKIEDAIGRIVEEHNDDPTSHLEDGQSLTSHRASEIIDHRAESVVNDKLKKNSRRYVAIVDPESPSDFSSVTDACEYAKEMGGGIVFIKRGTYTISEDIYLYNGVDLEGEGIDETILNFDGGSNQIILPKYFSVGMKGFSGCSLENGSDIVTVPSTRNLYFDNVGAGLTMFDSDDTEEYFEIESVDSTTQFTLKTPYTGMTGTKYIEIQLIGYFENGSRYVVYNDDVDLQGLGIVPGCTLDGEEGGLFTSIVKNVIGNNVVECEDIFTGTSQTTYGVIWMTEYPYNVAKYLTFYNCQNSLLFDNPDELAMIWLLGCKFYNCQKILNQASEGRIGKVQDCQIIDCVDTYLFDADYLYFYNNTIEMSDNSVIVLKAGYPCVVEQNKLRANGQTGIYLTRMHREGTQIINNDLEDVEGLDKGDYDISNVRITGNNIVSDALHNLNLNFKYSIINNNILKTTSGYHAKLISSSRKNIFIGNWLNYSITDLGVGNIILPNVIGT